MEYIKIKDILSFQKKSKIKASEGSKIGKYNFYTSSKEQNKFSDYYEYSNEALIIGTGGNANLHHSYGKFSVSTDCLVLESKDKNFLIEFIYRYLLKNIYILENGFRGAGLKHISKEYLENIKIPIIPLEKQKIIIKVLKNIDIFIDENKQIKNNLNFLSKSLFTTMFGDIKTNDKNWEIKKFHEIISILTDYHANGSYKILKDNVELLDFKEYALMIRTTDLENNNFIQGVKYINEKAYNFLKKTKIFGGELIINKIGSAGNVYLMPYLNIPVSLGMNQFMIRLKKDYSNIFYYKLLTTEYYTNVIKSNVQGAVTKTITKEAIKNIDIIIPPIELQNKFAERVEKIEKLKFEIEKSIEIAQNLYDSLISKYFDN